MKSRFRSRPGLRRSPFGVQLIALLDARGLSLEEFAKKVGTPRSTLFKVVQGTRKPPLAELDGWVKALALDKKDATALVLAAVEGHGCTSLRAAMGR